VSRKDVQIPVIPELKDLIFFPIVDLVDGLTTDFDLYISLGARATLYAASPYRWTQGEMDRLLKDGHATLYYSSASALKVEIYRKMAALSPIDRTSEPRIRILNLTEVGAELNRILYEYPLTPGTYSLIKDISAAMVETVLEDHTCIAALGKLANHDYYTYYHSARVAAYALAVAMHQSVSDKVALGELALGCLLHDIGKSKIKVDIINKTGVLNPDEWAQMKLHPELGSELVQESIISAIPRAVILQHHERLDGRGYPHGLTKRELLPEVRIAAFADVFDALTTNRAYQASRTRFEALDLIRFKLLDGLDADVFKAMVEILEKSAIPKG
jgi:HD-GYP domain-containing protein (c-di-GMP phosphodiesterase class II)